MAKNANFVSHKKSKQTVDGKPKLPLASDLVEGEIAINFGKDVETLSIKNESGDVVTFSSDNYYTEKKLGSGFTRANSANTVTSVVGSGFTSSSITDVIIENEEIVSAALTDLDERKLDASAYTPTDLSNYYTKSEVDARDLWASGTGENAIVQKGGNNTASGVYSVAMGIGTTASGGYSVAEGNNTSATTYQAHAEGQSTLASGFSSHAEGFNTTASAYVSHAEGNYTKASGDYSHAEGNGTTASGRSSHAEGMSTTASGNYSHSEGNYTSATSYVSHAEGYYTITLNEYEHASGQYNVSNNASTIFGNSGNTLFSVGNGTADSTRHNAFEIRQNGDIYIVSGNSDIKLQDYIGGGGGSITVDQVIDSGTSASTNAVATKAVYEAITDNELVWTNAYVTLSGAISSHTENTEIHVTAADKEKLHTHSNKTELDSITGTVGTMAYQNTSSYSSATEVNTALGGKANTATTLAGYGITDAYTKTEVDARDLWVSGTGTSSVAQKDGNNTASGKLSVAMGSGTTASGDYSVAEGRNTKASGSSSHAEGNSTTASSSSSHAEGFYTIASGSSSHAEGYRTTASGTSSHAEGMSTTAGGSYSHAEGQNTIASGESSHAEGFNTTASAYVSHAEGYNTTASGQSSHAEGEGTKANNKSEHASGQYNVSNNASTIFGDGGNTLFSVGNGTASNARHNAFEIRQNGDIYIVSGNSDIKLQDYIGGGGASVELWESGTGENAIVQKGGNNTASGNYSRSEGSFTMAGGDYSHAEGYYATAYNNSEYASGRYNNSVIESLTFGNSGNTLFSVGNGTSTVAKHNAFEIRQNGDIYITTGGTNTSPSIKLQDYIGIVSAVTVNSNMSNVTCPDSITGSSNTGAKAMVIYENGGTTTDYTITVSTSYKSPDGSQISITCPKNGYCEVNYVNINGTIYARGA